MTLQGMRADQITQVRGFADQRLRKSDAPLDPSNRRISLIVQYIQQPIEEPVAASREGGKTGEGKAGGEARAKPTGSEALPGGTEKEKQNRESRFANLFDTSQATLQTKLNRLYFNQLEQWRNHATLPLRRLI